MSTAYQIMLFAEVFHTLHSMKCTYGAGTPHATLQDAEKSCKQNNDCYGIYYSGNVM